MLSRHLQLLVACLALAALACGDDAGRIDRACTSNSDCAETELCGTGICEGGLGTCLPRPTECDDTITSFVCGCNGRTYQSECFASLDGVRLAQLGACNCQDNSTCDADQFCALDDSCLNPGECLPRPSSCETAEIEPVCGCDNMTYDSQCSAFQAGARVSASGMCECTSNDECGTDEFCQATVCDGPGFCESRDVACPPSEETVTGCNGILYPSACSANQVGQRVRP